MHKEDRLHTDAKLLEAASLALTLEFDCACLFVTGQLLLLLLSCYSSEKGVDGGNNDIFLVCLTNGEERVVGQRIILCSDGTIFTIVMIQGYNLL